MVNPKNQVHSIFSASKAHCWMNCPGSIKAEKSYPDVSSKWAAEGTLAHEVASSLLWKDDWTCPENKYIEQYLSYIALFKKPQSSMVVEHKIFYEHLVKGGFGTVDCALVTGSDLDVFDLKYGRGVLVDDHTQLKFYASGLVEKFNFLHDIKTIRLHIVQPRLIEVPFVLELKIKDLKKWEKETKKKIKLVLVKNPKRIPGVKQCRFCKAKADCIERADFVTDELLSNFNDETKLTDTKRRLILDNKELIQSLLNDIEQSVHDRLIHGEKFEGYKLVESRSTRIWKPQAESRLKKLLGIGAFSKKLIGITEAQKKIGKKEMEDITFKPPGRLVVASESNPKPAVSPVSAFNVEV